MILVSISISPSAFKVTVLKAHVVNHFWYRCGSSFPAAARISALFRTRWNHRWCTMLLWQTGIALQLVLGISGHPFDGYCSFPSSGIKSFFAKMLEKLVSEWDQNSFRPVWFGFSLVIGWIYQFYPSDQKISTSYVAFMTSMRVSGAPDRKCWSSYPWPGVPSKSNIGGGRTPPGKYISITINHQHGLGNPGQKIDSDLFRKCFGHGHSAYIQHHHFDPLSPLVNAP